MAPTPSPSGGGGGGGAGFYVRPPWDYAKELTPRERRRLTEDDEAVLAALMAFVECVN